MRFTRLAKTISCCMVLILVVGATFFWLPEPAAYASAAAISLSPSTGSFVVDSTFDVGVYLDTGDQSVNAVDLSLKFPPDKLQLVSSSTGKSIIGIWPALPKFNNQTGDITLTGGIPNGISTSHGLITSLTFRARAIGSAVVKVRETRILSNDGSGTEIPVTINNSVYQIVLPPPAGPVIASSSHPDQNSWYNESTVSLYWGDEGGVEGFSYVISDQPIDIPDDISEGLNRSIVYNNIADGRHYFHVKGLRNGQWGGTSHFAVNIDKTPPAQFKIDVIPSARTSRHQPVIQFATTDRASGMSHYELKILALQPTAENPTLGQDLFIEATSPFVPTMLLENGKYDVIIRAFDQAKNFTEVTQRLEIVPVVLESLGADGLQIRSTWVVPWWVVWSSLALAILILLLLAYLFKRHHDRLHQSFVAAGVPQNLSSQMQELQRYREKYGKALMLILAISISLLGTGRVHAQTNSTAVLAPPLISTINKHIANDELFYAGGFTGIPGAQVILFMQNLSTGETQQFTVNSDSKGEWFYRSENFLTVGDYEVWGQSKLAGQLSPPSSQVQLTVDKKAIQFGSSRVSLPTLYLLIIIILVLILLFIIFYILHHYRKIQQKNMLIAKQAGEIEASIRRGFAVLSRDIQVELSILRQSKRLTASDKAKEEHLLHDLEEIEQHLSKEIWELEETQRI